MSPGGPEATIRYKKAQKSSGREGFIYYMVKSENGIKAGTCVF
jgi:hypothetical protein